MEDLSGAARPVNIKEVLIEGNTKTKEELIQAYTQDIKKATTLHELSQAVAVAKYHLSTLRIFDSCQFKLAPTTPSGTANAIVRITELEDNRKLGINAEIQGSTKSVGGFYSFINLFGYGDIWTGSLSHSNTNQVPDINVGVSVPRFKTWVTAPMEARIYSSTKDCLKYSSFRDQSLGVNLGLKSNNSYVEYDLAWRTLTDPTKMSSESVRNQLGRYLYSTLKYTYQIDNRDSIFRPTQGYAFASTSQIGGLLPGLSSPRFLRQEFDFRVAFPLKVANAALNFGVGGGVLFPWGNRLSNKQSSFIPDRFFSGGGNSSSLCRLGGLSSTLLGFRSMGIGPTEPRRELNSEIPSNARDCIGGDLATGAFVDLSFDLPKVLSNKNIYGHAFACAGNVTTVQDASLQKTLRSFRSSAGIGVVLPLEVGGIKTTLQVDYCIPINKHVHDRPRKPGFQFNIVM